MNSSGLHIHVQHQQGGGGPVKQGAFGCIFSPPLQCKNKTAKPSGNIIGKVTAYADIKNEIVASKYLKQFSKAPEYCILPDVSSICEPDIESEARKDDIDSCNVIQDSPDKKYFQFHVKYGGETLKRTLLKINPTFETFPFFKIMRELLEIGAFLVIHGFIHNDLHGNNIVLDDSFKPRLIDYGRSYIHDKITSAVVEELAADYNPGLGQIPPEISTEHGVREGIALETILNDIKKKKPALEWGEKILGLSRRKQIQEFRNFWLNSKSAQSKEWLDFYKLYWPVVDSWAIGHNLLQILRRMNVLEDYSKNKEWVQKRGVVKQVLRGLLHMAPTLRLDALQALALYDPMNHIVLSESGSKWLERKRTQEG
jgi:hypothetical protein